MRTIRDFSSQEFNEWIDEFNHRIWTFKSCRDGIRENQYDSSSCTGHLGLNWKFRNFSARTIFFLGLAPSVSRSSSSLLAFEGNTSGDFFSSALIRSEYDKCNVFIDNIVKSSIPNNDLPTIDDAMEWKDFLSEELQTINPDQLIILGKVSKVLFNSLDLKTVWGELLSIPHPSYYFRMHRSGSESFDKILKNLREGFF